MKLENFTGTWQFFRPGLGGRQELSAKAMVKDDCLILAIEHRDAPILKLQLQQSSLIGKYAFEDNTVSNSEEGGEQNHIELNISKSGTCLQGFPKGYANLEHWTFERV